MSATGRQRIGPGVTLDGFLIGERIHNGGMATLWEVTRSDIDFPILMKVPKISEGADPAAIVSFEMEQMILARLSGPHVPRFVANGDFAVHPYIVMERISGTSLLPYLQRLPLSYSEVADIGAKVAAALDDLHRQHVVHLDVKPSNLMFRPTGEAVLIDFGLSHHDELPDFMAEEFRLPYGTAPYMAPEQVLGHRHDPRSDQFALGVLMYFFAIGTRPFGDPQRLSGLKRRLWRDPTPPRYLRLDFPPWLQEIIFRCLEVNPAWRYPTANQLAFDLLNPEQVKLTARSTRLLRDHFITVLKRRFRENLTRPVQGLTVTRYGAEAPIVAVAIDLAETTGPLAEELRATVAQILRSLPGARLACLNVFKLGIITLDNTLDDKGGSKHVQRLLELRHWAEPLKLEDGRVSVHVLESPRPAEVILWYARTNHVDHIVMGARTESTKRNLLGSVSGEVAAHAPCTVTVVRSSRFEKSEHSSGSDDQSEAS
jgi:non-specific serine/threonine protein kinase/protein-serine/threonine kinase